MQLIGFGASSMEGVGDSEGGFFQRFQNAVSPQYSDLTFVNLGTGGNTTHDMLTRVEAGAHQQELNGEHSLIVLLGCNDVPRVNDKAPHRRATLDEYERNLRALLPLIRGANSLFISSFPVCATRTGVQEETLASYMAAASAVASECGYALWDLYGELKDTDLTPYWAKDGLHFNNEGHALLTTRLASYLPLLTARPS
jgi:lysophospholipase L1-like esterase